MGSRPDFVALPQGSSASEPTHHVVNWPVVARPGPDTYLALGSYICQVGEPMSAIPRPRGPQVIPLALASPRAPRFA